MHQKIKKAPTNKRKCLLLLAGAPGIEPGNAGIKIRCLTAWRRPNKINQRVSTVAENQFVLLVI